MRIKNKKALDNLREKINKIDKLISRKSYDTTKNAHAELNVLLQGLKTDLNNSIDFSENAELRYAIELAEKVMKSPKNQILISNLITQLEKNKFGNVNADDIHNLKLCKSFEPRVQEYTASILSQLKS